MWRHLSKLKTHTDLSDSPKYVVVAELLSPVLLFCDPVDCCLVGSSLHGISQGISLIQGSNLHLVHWQAGSLLLNHQGSLLLILQMI